MDFLNKAFSQLSDLFQSMTPGARITAGLLLAVVVVGLGFLFTYQASGPEVDLFSGTPVPPTQISQIEAAFAKKGLNDYEIENNRIRIPRGQRDVYLAAVAEARALPPNFDTAFDKALEDTGWISSREEREMRLKLAKQKTLGLIISQMSGIESASVIYDVEVNRHAFNRQRTTTATAAVKPTGSEQLSEGQVASIRSLVAGTIAGLKPNEVTVADLNGPTWHGNPEGGGTALDDPYSTRKRMYEQEWQAKILNALAYVPGVKVTPNVELDRERERTERRVQHDPKPVVVQEAEETNSRLHEGAEPGGRPGYVAQQPNTPVQLATDRGGGSREEQEDSKRQTVAVTSGTQEETFSVGLTPLRVSVSVAIPSGYFQKIWRERSQVAEGTAQPPDEAQLEQIRTDETNKIRRLVANLLPPAKGVEDRTELVEIMTFQGFTPEEVHGPTYSEHALTWLARHWSTVGMLLVAAFSLVMLRSMILAGPTERRSLELFRKDTSEPEESDREAAATVVNRLARFNKTGRSLRDELSDLVQENPDAAANILKSWIGQSG